MGRPKQKIRVGTYSFVKNILLFFSSFMLVSCQPKDSSEADNNLTTDSPAVDLESAGLTGLLQSSGLQPQEAKKLGVPENSYQLLSQENYFLLSDEDLTQHWGQCLTVFGKEIEFPAEDQVGDSAAQVYAYERKLFRVQRVEPNVYSFCAYSDSLRSRQPGKAQVQAYEGTVHRQRRPAPDIAYDYYLQAEDERISSATGELTSKLNLYATDFNVLSNLENAARTNQRLKVWAAEQAGYAEQLALHVIRTENVEGTVPK